MNFPIYFLILVLIVITFCKNNGKAQETCETTTKVEMSQGFITAALSNIGPLGVGNCTYSICSVPLMACPNSSCCLPNFGGKDGVRSCGCQQKTTSGGVKCVDPNTFIIDISTKIGDTGVTYNLTLELFPFPNARCVNQTKSELVTMEDGNTNLLMHITSCLPKEQRGKECKDQRKAKKSCGLIPTGIGEAMGAINSMFEGLAQKPSKLYHALGSQQVERLMLYHETLTKSEKAFASQPD